MSEKLLKILLSELNTVRLVCQGKRQDGAPCGATIEMPLDRLDSAFAMRCACQFCGTPFAVSSPDGTAKSPFPELVAAFRNLNAISRNVRVEFVLPDKDGK